MTTPADDPPHCAEHRIVSGRTIYCTNPPTAFEYGRDWCEEHRPTRRKK